MARKPHVDSREGGRSPSSDGRASRLGAFPQPSDSDVEDVHWALTAAAKLWDSGDAREALRWLRRAAASATEYDADARAVELYKVAAEVAGALEAGRTPHEGESALVPAVPPETRVYEVPRAKSGRLFDDGEEDTSVHPETRLRRALMAIDPDYDRRTAYSEDDDVRASEPDGAEARGSAEQPAPRARTSTRSDQTSHTSWHDSLQEPRPPSKVGSASDEDTQKQHSLASIVRMPSNAALETAIPGALPAVRVAVLAIPEERDVRLVFLSPGAVPPAGVAVALLVPQSEDDARRISAIYEACEAKL